MYGIIIQGLKYMITSHFGEEMTRNVLAKIGILEFSIYERYSEKIIPDVLCALAQMTGQSDEEIGILAGRYFVRFMYGYGHGELLRVLGRRFSDFLKGLDNLHAYFRLSYPRIKPPSFSCDNETADGLTLHYRSRRKGYVSYVMGQMIEVARTFYNQELTVELSKKFEKGGFQYVMIRMTFDNSGFDMDKVLKDRSMSLNEFLPVDPVAFLNLFPYLLAFERSLEIVATGKALLHILPDLHGRRITDVFNLQRPHIKFRWDTLMHHIHDVYELRTIGQVGRNEHGEMRPLEDKVRVKVPKQKKKQDKIKEKTYVINNENNEVEEQSDGEEEPDMHFLTLRGAMIYLSQSKLLVLLPSAIINDLDEMYKLGLNVSDYSASDCNREMIMVAAQKSDDMKDLLLKEKDKSKALMKTFMQIDESKKRAEDLLSTMMPPEVARELLDHGREKLSICDTFNTVTLSFVKVCNFNEITSHLPPLDVVNVLNTIYSTFDSVIKKHGIYKVETVGECYMMSCGVPYPNDHHAEYLADTVLDLINQMLPLVSTLIPGKSTEIKIGAHSGAVVGAIVGLRAPRYCLFGDTVNCASRLESHNKVPMTIQISQATKDKLDQQSPNLFVTQARGTVNLKGKGDMNAYTLVLKKGPSRYEKNPIRRPSLTRQKEGEPNNAYTMVETDAEMTESLLSRMSVSQEGTKRNPAERLADVSSVSESSWKSSAIIEDTTNTITMTKIGSSTLQPLALSDISPSTATQVLGSHSQIQMDKAAANNASKLAAKHVTIEDNPPSTKMNKIIKSSGTKINDTPIGIIDKNDKSSKTNKNTPAESSTKLRKSVENVKTEKLPELKNPVVKKKTEEDAKKLVKVVIDAKKQGESSKKKTDKKPDLGLVMQNGSIDKADKRPSLAQLTALIKTPPPPKARNSINKELSPTFGGGKEFLVVQPCNCENFIEKQRLKTTICSLM